MNRFFKWFLVAFTLLLVVATIAEIAAPAVADGWGVQWPVYVGFWVLDILLWAVALGLFKDLDRIQVITWPLWLVIIAPKLLAVVLVVLIVGAVLVVPLWHWIEKKPRMHVSYRRKW